MEKNEKKMKKNCQWWIEKKVLYIYTVKIHIIIIIIIILYILSILIIFYSQLNYSINYYVFPCFPLDSVNCYCQSRSVNVDLSMYALLSLVNLDLSKFLNFLKNRKNGRIKAFSVYVFFLFFLLSCSFCVFFLATACGDNVG